MHLRRDHQQPRLGGSIETGLSVMGSVEREWMLEIPVDFKFNRHSLSVSISLLNLRQIKAEGASLADFTLDHDLTTVSFQNEFHQCQTQARASVAPF